MIEGLKVTIAAAELKELCEQAAVHHRNRSKAYEQQMDRMANDSIERSDHSSVDPFRQIKEKRDSHDGLSAELEFIAAHLNPKETYLLDRHDLAKLGIAKGW